MLILVIVNTNVRTCTRSMGPIGRKGIVSNRMIRGNARGDLPCTAVLVIRAKRNAIDGRSKRFHFGGIPTKGCALEIRLLNCRARRGGIAIDGSFAMSIRFLVDSRDVVASRMIMSTGHGRADHGITPIMIGIVGTGLFRSIGSASLTGSLGCRSKLHIRGGYRGYNFPRIHVGKLRKPCSRVLVGDHPMIDTLSNICNLRRVPIGVVRHMRIIHKKKSTLFNTGTINKAVGVKNARWGMPQDVGRQVH